MPRFSLGRGEVYEFARSQLATAPRSVLAEAAGCTTGDEEIIDLSSWSKRSESVFKVSCGS